MSVSPYSVKVKAVPCCSEEVGGGAQSTIEHRLVLDNMCDLFHSHRVDRNNYDGQIVDTLVEVNDPHQDLRCQNDTFGRKIMLLRRSLTNDDATPLPTIS